MKTKTQLIFLSLLLFFCLGQSGFAQTKSRKNSDPPEEEVKKKRNVELGYNVTTVLSHFIGNASLIEASDFPVILRIGAKKVKFRIALGVSGSSSEFFDNISGTFRVNDFAENFLKLGFEKEFFKEDKWTGYFGFDLIGNLIIDKVTSFGFEQVELTNTTIGVGGGPFLGIKYHLNSRIYFSTESTLFVLAKNIKLKQTINGVSTQIQDTNDYTASLQSPLSLYLNYRF